MSTDRQEDRNDSLQVDAARKRRLMDSSNQAIYEAEWRTLVDECRREVRTYGSRSRLAPEATTEIEALIVQRLPKIVEAFNPGRESGAGFRTFLRKPIEFADKDYRRSGTAERTEVGVFSAPDRIGDGDGSGAAEVPRIARNVLHQTWDESTPVSSLEEIEEQHSWKSRAALFVANSRFTRQEKRFFKQVELDHRSAAEVAEEAAVEVSKVTEAVKRVRKAVDREVSRDAEESTTSNRRSPTRKVDWIRVSIASPKQIRAQSFGEICEPKTLNPLSLKPVKGGLMCERIFGPMRDWNCDCDKNRGPAPPGSRCPRCARELLPASARRQRMGHIELAAPVLNGWLFRENASLVCHLLGMNRSEVDALIYRQGILVLAEGSTSLQRHQVLDYKSLKEAQEIHGPRAFNWGIGATALREALAHVDLGQRLAQLEAEMAGTTCRFTRKRCLAWATQLKALIESDQRLEWMVMDVLPVLPAGLRPEIPLPPSSRKDSDQEDDSGRKVEKHRFATSDLNRLYRRVLVENRQVRELREACAPEPIVYHRIASLQKAVDALLHVGRSASNQRRELKPLVQCLEGKGGRFRGNLLGKRVDYSGRAVIVVGPELKLHQCGIPLKLGVKLFEPLLVRRLRRRGLAATTKDARCLLENNPAQHRADLEAVAKGKLVLLNRAPTLHRLSVQAFEPIFIAGDAIQLHPMACAAFGADFDGDQMAVHLPLSELAQGEARALMTAQANALSPRNGQPVFAPSQDIVLGCYYLTLEPWSALAQGSTLASLRSTPEVLLLFQSGHLKTHDRIRIPNPDQDRLRPYGASNGRIISTTVGRVVLNDALNEDLGFVNEPLDKSGLGKLVATAYRVLGADKTHALLDRVKEAGFAAATRAGISIGVADLVVPQDKDALIQEAKAMQLPWSRLRDGGIITEEELREASIAGWNRCKQKIKERMTETLAPSHAHPEANPLWLMLKSKARGTEEQVVQLAGLRGIMDKMNGDSCERPVTSNFREGMSPADLCVSVSGARKGLHQRSRVTAEAGYLTRKLVHAAHDVLITVEDCGTNEGRPVVALKVRDKILISLSDRLAARVVAADVADPKDPSTILVRSGSLMPAEEAERIECAGVECAVVRSVLTCRARKGICSRCYGIDPSTGSVVQVGTPVGVIAAQSIGEPGTQLLMQTFHRGGVATGARGETSDITESLSRITKILEARKPKKKALLASMAGIVAIEDGLKRSRVIRIRCQETERTTETSVPFGRRILVSDGDLVRPGTRLTDGEPDPNDQVERSGLLEWQTAALDEVLTVFAEQGASIADQHLEIVVREMSRRLRIITPGDSRFLADDLIDRQAFEAELARVKANGGRPPMAKPHILGISKLPALAESYLTTAAFQRTSTVLAQAAVLGKTAAIRDMAGKVMTGGLIPAGTGFDPQEAEADRPVRHPRRGQRSSRKGKANYETH